MTLGTIVSVQVGKVAPFGPKRTPSAFNKSPVNEPAFVHVLGIDGDQQADPRYHGGPDKAVYGYAANHYDSWRAEHPEHATLLVPGAFAENLTIDGLVEADICVGDVHAIGDVRLQVCQPREPCSKLGIKFNDNKMPKAMTRTRRSGWYYRVLQEGLLQAGDAVTLTDRPHPDFPLERLIAIAYKQSDGASDWEALAKMEGAAADWREYARKAQKR